MIVGPEGWGPDPLPGREREGVVFAGAVDAAVLAGLYRRARAFAYVPLTEGYGLPPLEAMRAGTPSVIANEVPSVVDLDEPGPPPALVVDPFDVEDIAGALTAILTDDAVRADLAARGEAHWRSRTWRDVARQHIGLWQVTGVTGGRLALSLDVSAVPLRPGGAGHYTMALARGLGARQDIALTMVSRRGDEERWRAVGAGRGRVVGAVPARRARLASPSSRCASRVSSARSGADVHHGPHYTMPERAPVPCVVTDPRLHVLRPPRVARPVQGAASSAGPSGRRACTPGALVCVSEVTADTGAGVLRRAGPDRGGPPRGGPRALHGQRTGTRRRSRPARGERDTR